MRITTPFVSTANPLGAVLAWLATGLLSVATLVLCPYNGAEAHGIAGNRLFLGTLTFDDPAVNDEFSSAFSDLRRSAPEGTAVDKALSVGLSRLLTPRLAFATGSTWIDRNTQATSNTRGFDTTSLALKGLLYENDPHETLLSAAFGWGLPGVGSRPLGAHGSIEPGIFFGRVRRFAVQPLVAAPFCHLRSARLLRQPQDEQPATAQIDRKQRSGKRRTSKH